MRPLYLLLNEAEAANTGVKFSLKRQATALEQKGATHTYCVRAN